MLMKHPHPTRHIRYAPQAPFVFRGMFDITVWVFSIIMRGRILSTKPGLKILQHLNLGLRVDAKGFRA